MINISLSSINLINGHLITNVYSSCPIHVALALSIAVTSLKRSSFVVVFQLQWQKVIKEKLSDYGH